MSIEELPKALFILRRITNAESTGVRVGSPGIRLNDVAAFSQNPIVENFAFI